MSSKAKIFIGLVIALGWLELARSPFLWQSDDLAGFLVYFLIALLVSGLKLQLPGVTGTISVCYFFVLIGIVSLNLPQVLVTGCSAVLVQYLWQSAQRLRLVQMLFNVASAGHSSRPSVKRSEPRRFACARQRNVQARVGEGAPAGR